MVLPSPATPYMAIKTQYELNRPAIAKDALLRARPTIRTRRAPIRSTKKTDRRLHDAGDHIEHCERQRKLGVADIEIGAHKSQQRRKHQQIVMAHHVRGADAGNQPRLGRRHRAY